jgi:hypothetical protein
VGSGRQLANGCPPALCLDVALTTPHHKREKPSVTGTDSFDKRRKLQTLNIVQYALCVMISHCQVNSTNRPSHSVGVFLPEGRQISRSYPGLWPNASSPRLILPEFEACYSPPFSAGIIISCLQGSMMNNNRF